MGSQLTTCVLPVVKESFTPASDWIGGPCARIESVGRVGLVTDTIMPHEHPAASQASDVTRTAAPVLQAVALTKTYQMGALEVRALRGVDLTLVEGEFLVLLGP